ncbi:WD40 repeat domain-containing protein [Aspergillus chevalieri]|uniref:WD repeat protein n=1 Tax=Aspergillus chevalieri TaxID=182096 RepID=A0A7R7ZJ14_ASPCH|nr:uncharacterized protein ACHE_10491S [Aspergillus chevalieri]BCR83089.1 hypothetical protein ACHE_10491S [Aspergillus chevalieri]
MSHPDLTSHHVNYLIWRYLQESGLGDAAVMLQRAWNHDPQSLPFAPYIRTHALVSLVQKGLQYHELEKSLDKEGNPVPFTPSSYFFGPQPLESDLLRTPAGPAEAADHAALVSPTSKVARDAATNGHLTAETGKKSRKGDRADTAVAAANGEESSMEIDTNGIHKDHDESPVADATIDGDGDVSMIRSESQGQEPAAPPPPPPPPTLATGHSVGVQISPAKAADLSPGTALLNVAGKDHVTRTLWRPRDPTVVVAAGDTFCSLWKLSSSSQPAPENLVDGSREDTCVSAVAWDPTGQKLAVATYNDMRGSITMYDVHGHAVDLLPEVPRMITGLHWAESGSHLVVVASDSRVSELALWDDSLRPDVFPAPQVIDGSIYDLSWIGPNQAFACSDGSVYQCQVDSSIHITRTFSSGAPDTTWTFIRCASAGPSSSMAVAASSSTASFWIPTHDMRLDEAHQGDITAIELRADSRQSPFVLASSSADDTVKIWHIDPGSKRFECIHRLFLGPSIPALAGCFSPDGYALAAASKERLYIWNAERGGSAMATWALPSSEDAKEGPDQAVNGHNGTGDSLPDRSLSWDTNGKKLAFGVGHQMAIVNLQR